MFCDGSNGLMGNLIIFISLPFEQGKKVCKTTGFRSLSFSNENKVNIHIKKLKKFSQKVFSTKKSSPQGASIKIILSPRIANTKIC